MRSFSTFALSLTLVAGLGSSPASALVTASPATTKPVPLAIHTAHNITRSIRSFITKFNPLSIKSPLPANAKDFRYVLVKGLIGDKYPRYMARSLEALQSRGLEAEFAQIDTGASVAHNSAIIEQMIESSTKPIVFIAHSKGVADTTDAIGRMAKIDPAMVQSKVRGLVSLEGAYRGSQVADALASSKWGMRAMKTLAFFVRGSVDAGLDLRTSVRRAAVADHPMPTNLVLTVSFVGYKLRYTSFMAPTVFLMKKLFGVRGDGLVAHQDAVIDGGDVARYPIDHAQGAFGKYSDRLTLSLVGHVLSQPQQLSAF